MNPHSGEAFRMEIDSLAGLLFRRPAFWPGRTSSEEFRTPVRQKCNEMDDATLRIGSSLQKGRVLRINDASEASMISVESGVIWLTEVGGFRDVLVKAGTETRLGTGWPIVIEALEHSQIRLFPLPSERKMRRAAR